MEDKQVMDIIEDADCNAEACFTDSKKDYAPLGWAKTMVEVAYKAGQEAERKRIIALLDADFALAPYDDSYLRLLVEDTKETLRTGKTHKQRADENYDRLQVEHAILKLKKGEALKV